MSLKGWRTLDGDCQTPESQQSLRILACRCREEDKEPPIHDIYVRLHRPVTKLLCSGDVKWRQARGTRRCECRLRQPWVKLDEMGSIVRLTIGTIPPRSDASVLPIQIIWRRLLCRSELRGLRDD
nr:hypothetical protein CFP56_64747 [Quercus suber]